MPPHAEYRLVLGLVIATLDPRDRAVLALASRACSDLARLPCPCTKASVILPPPPGSAPTAWLATHRASTLIIRKRMQAPTSEFLECVRALVDAVSSLAACPRRLEIACPFVGDTRSVCELAGVLLRAGVEELAVSAPGALPPQDAVDLCLGTRTRSVELELDVDELRLSGSAARLEHLSLANSKLLRVLRTPDGGLPALQSLSLGGGVRLCEVARHPLRRLCLDDSTLVTDPRVPVESLCLVAPCRLDCWADSGVRELEVDMWHRRSDEVAFGSLGAWPHLHTLVLRDVRRLSALDDLVSWSITGLPPNLRCLRAHVPVDDAVDPPRAIQRYCMHLAHIFRLECTCDFV